MKSVLGFRAGLHYTSLQDYGLSMALRQYGSACELSHAELSKEAPIFRPTAQQSVLNKAGRFLK